MVALILACGGGDDTGFPAGDGSTVVIATITRSAGATPATSPAVETTPGITDTLPAGPSSGPETATPEAPAVLPTATSAPSGNGSAALSGFIYPIAGACLPQGDQLMPNAPRTYRNGIHEGVDFYGVDNCVAIGLGTPVLAAKAGTVIRIDHSYTDLTPATLDALFLDPTSPQSFDAFRGRQVWVDHGDGIVTYYCHLSGVVETLQAGDTVTQGQTIAYVGESGTPGSIQAPGAEYHLHWEVRIGDSYLGAGQGPAQVRALFLALFE